MTTSNDGNRDIPCLVAAAVVRSSMEPFLFGRESQVSDFSTGSFFSILKTLSYYGLKKRDPWVDDLILKLHPTTG